MDPEAFIAEVYRRMSLRAAERPAIGWEEIRRSPMVRQTVARYRGVLPEDRDAAILDVGFGDGWFLAACVELGYRNLRGAEFGGRKQHLTQWSPAIREILAIDTNVGDLLREMPEAFDFIHLSHVIEHIPKHTLLYNCDAIYRALGKGGTLLVRTPNMEGPCATSSLYVTLGHEYGFTGSNLASLLEICQFEEIRFQPLAAPLRSLRQRAGALVRWPIVRWNAFKHRYFGVNRGGQYHAELVVSARRGERPPLFDDRCR